MNVVWGEVLPRPEEDSGAAIALDEAELQFTNGGGLRRDMARQTLFLKG